MSFQVGADAYDRFMGRYAAPLAPRFADFARVEAGQRLLDVGCGPGALTAELVARVGAPSVTAVDPSPPFVAAVQERYPLVGVRQCAAEELPFADDTFDATLAQLVVHFMADPVAGLAEMRRVTRPGGVVAACVWDHEGGTGPLSAFWDAARDLAPDVEGESRLAGSAAGDLARLLEAAGCHDVEETALTVEVEHPTFEEWWEPFELGVGPAGAYVAGLDATARTQLRERCSMRLATEPFTVRAGAWAARGRA